ncbi:MAG: M24 family metallopeptidase [Acidimicrobiia bacterium]
MTLPPLSVGPRLERLRPRFAAVDVDALLVSHLPNVRYLTGFTGSAAVVLVGPEQALLVTDGRYETQAAEQIAGVGAAVSVEIGATQAKQQELLDLAIRERGYERLGLEAEAISWAGQRRLAEAFTAVELVATKELVEELRRVKEPAEVARIRTACEIGVEALAVVAPSLAAGPTEQDVALALEVEMRRRGASGNSFPPIVAAGPNGAQPHARPSARPIEAEELVVLDFGCVVDGYCSDMTRTVSVGDPGADATAIFDLVAESQRVGSLAVRAGTECAAVDRACREVIDAAGWGEAFSHSTGHGVGIEIHEAPRVAATAGDTLAAGYVVTVEPGVYVPGVGGVRIEDTVVVTDDGADVLTNAPKDLIL